MATQMVTAASITNRAGNSRRARRAQKLAAVQPTARLPAPQEQVGNQIAAKREKDTYAEESSRRP